MMVKKMVTTVVVDSILNEKPLLRLWKPRRSTPNGHKASSSNLWNCKLARMMVASCHL
jgi:hypothetical protein